MTPTEPGSTAGESRSKIPPLDEVPRRFRLIAKSTEHQPLYSGKIYGCFWPEWHGGLVLVAWPYELQDGLVIYRDMRSVFDDPLYVDLVDRIEWLD